MKSDLFAGPTGEQLKNWVIENGHLAETVPVQDEAVARHNMAIQLLHDFGYSLEIVEAEIIEEENIIDRNLDE